MFKFVVLSALLAAAVAEPQVFYSNPLATTYAATIAAPATTSTYVQRSSYIAPTVYSDIAFPHLIKKRSPQFLSSYVSPYVASAPLVTPYVAPAPITYSSSLLPTIAAPAHFIKKRSPQFLSTNYVAPYVAGAPLVTPYASTYVAPASITYSSPLVSALAAPAHLIKKRATVQEAAALLGVAPLTYPYAGPAPLASTYYSGVIPTAPYYPGYSGYGAGFPFIKK